MCQVGRQTPRKVIVAADNPVCRVGDDQLHVGMGHANALLSRTSTGPLIWAGSCQNGHIILSRSGTEKLAQRACRLVEKDAGSCRTGDLRSCLRSCRGKMRHTLASVCQLSRLTRNTVPALQAPWCQTRSTPVLPHYREEQIT